jgi:hypothetical protein
MHDNILRQRDKVNGIMLLLFVFGNNDHCVGNREWELEPPIFFVLLKNTSDGPFFKFLEIIVFSMQFRVYLQYTTIVLDL